MQWRSVYRVIPVPIFYTDEMADDVGGYAWLGAVWIRARYANDEGLHQHELEHVRQFWTLPIAHGLLYKFVRRYRLWSEAAAYKIQMKFTNGNGVPLTLVGAATHLRSKRYRFGLTVEQAMEALT